MLDTLWWCCKSCINFSCWAEAATALALLVAVRRALSFLHAFSAAQLLPLCLFWWAVPIQPRQHYRHTHTGLHRPIGPSPTILVSLLVRCITAACQRLPACSLTNHTTCCFATYDRCCCCLFIPAWRHSQRCECKCSGLCIPKALWPLEHTHTHSLILPWAP